MAVDEPLMTVVQVSGYTQLKVQTVYQLVHLRRIPVVRLSKRCIRFKRADIERWLLSLTQQPLRAEGNTVNPDQQINPGKRRSKPGKSDSLSDSSLHAIVERAKKEVLP